MRIAISNIAWDVAEDTAVAHLLQRYRVDAIDIAPGKYFADPKNAAASEVARVCAWWAERGIEITGMQALLFGTVGLNLFAEAPVQGAMLELLEAVCHIGEGLGAKRLVFGSPKHRDCSGVARAEADDIAIRFFRRLGEIAERCGVAICLEPNPARYGCNFMTGTEDAARIVRLSAHPAIRLQIDTGAMAINEERAAEMIEANKDIIGHFHASEPDLVTLGDGGVRHDEVARALARHLPGQLVSIEMLSSKSEPALMAIERALNVAIGAYRPATAW